MARRRLVLIEAPERSGRDRFTELITVKDHALWPFAAQFASDHFDPHPDLNLTIEVGELCRKHRAFVKLDQCEHVRSLLFKACRGILDCRKAENFTLAAELEQCFGLRHTVRTNVTRREDVLPA